MSDTPRPFHAMRRKEREITDPAVIEAMLREATICHLGLVDDGAPYVVPVTIGYDGKALYFHSAIAGRKVDIIRRDGRVSFNITSGVAVVDQQTTCTVKYRSLTGSGVATILSTPEEKLEALQVLSRQATGHGATFPARALERTLVVRIDILEMKGKQAG